MSQNAETIQTETTAPVPPVVELPKPVERQEDAPTHERVQRDIGNASVVAAAVSGSPPGDNRPHSHVRAGFSNAAIARLLIQRKPEAGAPSAPAAAAPAQTVGPRIVDDRAELVQGQMRKTEFLTQLRTSVCNAAAEAFRGTRWSEEGCPYIERVFAYCATMNSERLERGIRRYAPETASVTTAAELIPIITARVQRSLTTWVRTGQVTGVPEDIPVSMKESGLAGAVAAIASGFATGFGKKDSSVGDVFYKHEDGATSNSADPVTVQSRLNNGQPLDAGVRTQMESAFGRSFGDVNVHTDPTATTLAKDLRARAFTVGTDIAFAPGQYQPGTLIGDALIAHELAHVAQQSGAGDETGVMQKAGDAHDDFEEAADQAAIGVVASRWASSEALAKLGSRTIPNLRSGLRLQRCLEGGDITKGKEVLREEELKGMGYQLVLPPGEYTVGRQFQLGYTAPKTIRATGTPDPNSFGKWMFSRPGEDVKVARDGIGYTHTFTLDKPGQWYFAVWIPMGTKTAGYLDTLITVRSIGEVAEEHIGKVPTMDPTGFLVRLELQNIENINMGIANQNLGGAYISLQGDNPARPHTNFPNTPENRYTVHPPANVKPARYQWAAIPDNLQDYPSQSRFGHYRNTIAGREGFNLGTGKTAFWTLAYETGVVHIYCTMYDDQGNVVSEARYRQVVLSSSAYEHAKRFQSYMEDAKKYLREIRHDTAVHIAGIHVVEESGAVNDVSLFFGVPVSGGGLKLVDLTPGVAVREYEGPNFASVVQKFNSGNSYPRGQIRLRVPQNNLGIQEQDWIVQTTGASYSERLSSGWGWASLGLAALGVIAAIIPGTQGLAPVFFLASAGLGVASAGASLYQLSREAHPSNTKILIDVASIAGSLLGMAGAANVLRHGPRVAALNMTGRFVLYTGFATDVMGGVFIMAEGADQIAAILDGRGTPDEKAAAITRILAGLMLNGTLLAWGAKDLGATRERLNKTLGTELTHKLDKLGDLHALSALEGPALARLAGASVEEIREVAALIRQDPVRASMLIERFGEGFVVAARSRPETLDELAQALHVGAPEAAGTRGTYGPVVAGQRRPSYELREGKGQSSPSGLASKIGTTFTNLKSPTRRELLHGATLADTGTPTNYLLTIPADKKHPEIVIPVRIESVGTLPVSVHGAETGPARMEIRTTKNAQGAVEYAASIEVHRDLAQADIRFAVGHELDELIHIARSGIRGSDITAQKRASLLRTHPEPGKSIPIETAHDLAEAREFADAVRERSPLGGRKPGEYGMPDDLVSRALSMGFGSTAYVEEKLVLLRNAGVDPDMLKRLRAMAYHAEISAAAPKASSLISQQVVGHLLHASPGGSPASPIHGLHLDSALLSRQAEMVSKNEKYHLLRTADSPITGGGVTYNAYEQWEWKAGGAPSVGSRPTNPAGVAGAKHGNWELASLPKTTFDKLSAFLIHADNTFRAWSAAQTIPAGANPRVDWSHTLPGGQAVGGSFSVDASGKVTHITVFPLRTGGLASW